MIKNKKEFIKNIPEKPGVYFWLNKNDEIIYIGKAINLKNRISQYVFEKANNSFKTKEMLQQIADVKYEICASDAEAFIRERFLINQYKPKYNVLFPIQANFPYLSVSYKPNKGLQIKIVSNYQNKPHSAFFGPLVSNVSHNELITYLRRKLLLDDRGEIIVNKEPAFWKSKVKEAKKIFHFSKSFIKELEKEELKASNNLNFEYARFLNNILKFIAYNKNEQTNIEIKQPLDILAIKQIKYENRHFAICFIRFYLDNIYSNDFFQITELTEEFEIKEFVFTFLNQIYEKNRKPDLLLVNSEFQNLKIYLESLIKNVEFYTDHHKYYDLAFNLETKADFTLKNDVNDFYKKQIKVKQEKFLKNQIILNDLRKHLKIAKFKNFVIFDNSFFNNTNSAVSKADVYLDLELSKTHSRHFNLNANLNSDVFYIEEALKKFVLSINEGFPYLDAIFVDGSITQIAYAKKALANSKLRNLPIFGLIKNNKHEFETIINDKNQEIIFDYSATTCFLSKIQSLVDRHAKNKYHQRMKKIEFQNEFLYIKGIGEIKAKKLFQKYITYEEALKDNDTNLMKILNSKTVLNNFRNKIRKNDN
ncbi:GIY-YIG nuclease family protein [[Mycoplasma] anseris]|uniref:Excinuclease ABC subunit C n=1 Tax=[Mycoplasma] anseris TaxID=92400 RepID=A0A2Z4NDE7_9BACT|nr:GIY-YIG nuclease family protein [[Mycoplasma] anseris]AWX69590.1 hypothetical protein DP065_02395 [[Mycoplasma] anseris]